MNRNYRKLCSLVVATAVMVSSVGTLSLAQSSAEESSGSSPAVVGELRNVAVVAGAPYKKLIGDVSFLGGLMGRPEIGQMVEGYFSLFTQMKGPKAIDQEKAWGVIVQTDGMSFYPVGCLPVVAPDDLITVAKGYGAQVKEGDDGITNLSMPNGESLFVKVVEGMGFIGRSAESLAKLPANAQEVLTKIAGEYDVVARVSVKNVPEMYRQMAIATMRSGAQQGLQQKEGESDEEYGQRQKMVEMQMAQMEEMINGIDSLTASWAIDAEGQRTYIDVSYMFLPGSKFAKQMASYKGSNTNFAGFYRPDAAASLTFATQSDASALGEEYMMELATSLEAVRQQAESGIDEKVEDADVRETLKAAIGEWIEAVEATLKTGELDGGASVLLGEESMTVIAGAKIAETAKLEAGLKKVDEAAMSSADYPGLQWNAANHAGVNFHTLAVPLPADEADARRLFGEELNVAIGIGKEAAYLAIGKENLEAVKKAIDASAAEPGKKVPPVELSISLTPIMAMAVANEQNEKKQAVLQQVVKYLQGEAQGRDHVRMVGQILPNGFKYRLEAEEGVLKAMGTAAKAAQQQQMESLQQP